MNGRERPAVAHGTHPMNDISKHAYYGTPGRPTDKRRGTDARLPSVLARNTLAIVLAGGRGTRLHRLTEWRAKPAVPFGGKFRIIDFTLSNCVNSGIRQIGIATQYRG